MTCNLGCNTGTKVLRIERCTALGGLASCSTCTEDIELEKEMNELPIRIEKIHIRRRALHMVMNANHDHLIHRFPPEIASHIFIQYAPPSSCFDEKDRSRPLSLGAVCQKWRQLAWSTPQLWSSLSVRFQYNREYPSQCIAAWLERSASLPLTIRFHANPRGDESNGHHEVINILNEHSARWRDVYFDLPSRSLHRLCGSSQGIILRRLILHHPFSPFTRDFSTFSMKSKPSPTDLTLRSVDLPYVDILWNNLTVASICRTRADECVELIRRAPLLEALTLQSVDPSSGVFPFPNTRIVRPHLRSLEASMMWEEIVVAEILDSVCLPSLKQWIHDESPCPLSNMVSFMGCLSSSLKIFKFNINTVDCHQVIGLLCNLPSLESLELRITRGPHPTDELLHLLCASAQSLVFLPRLQSLDFLYSCSFAWESLPQIFFLPQWRSLRVKVSNIFGKTNDIQDETARLLLELVEKGFDLRIVNNDNNFRT